VLVCCRVLVSGRATFVRVTPSRTVCATDQVVLTRAVIPNSHQSSGRPGMRRGGCPRRTFGRQYHITVIWYTPAIPPQCMCCLLGLGQACRHHIYAYAVLLPASLHTAAGHPSHHGLVTMCPSHVSLVHTNLSAQLRVRTDNSRCKCRWYHSVSR